MRGATDSCAHAAIGGGSERAQLQQLRHLDADLEMLERAQLLLEEAESAARARPREAFELSHRAALRIAGVLVARANRGRRRPLPLNAWRALEMIGGAAAERAREMTVLVRERDRLDLDDRAQPDRDLLLHHLRSTRRHLEEVRAELIGDLPTSALALAG